MIEKLGVKLYNVQEAAEILGVAVSTVRLMSYDRRIHSTKLGVRIYFTEETLRNYLINGAPKAPKEKSKKGKK